MKTLTKLMLLLILLASSGCSSQGFVKFLDIQPRDKFFVAGANPIRLPNCEGIMNYHHVVCRQKRQDRRLERVINRAIQESTPMFQGTILDPNYRK